VVQFDSSQPPGKHDEAKVMRNAAVPAKRQWQTVLRLFVKVMLRAMGG
jgi:hypothetical protein